MSNILEYLGLICFGVGILILMLGDFESNLDLYFEGQEAKNRTEIGSIILALSIFYVGFLSFFVQGIIYNVKDYVISGVIVTVIYLLLCILFRFVKKECV